MQKWKLLASRRVEDLASEIMGQADIRARQEFEALKIQKMALKEAEKEAMDAKKKAELAKKALSGQGWGKVETNEYLRKQALLQYQTEQRM